MNRIHTSEELDDPSLPAPLWNAAHRDLDWMHRVLGNYRAVFSRLGRVGAGTVIDIGCGNGALLRRLRHQAPVKTIGVDLRPPAPEPGIHYVAADATRDLLPPADAAVSLCMVHHLTEEQLIALIRNSRRSVRRLILLDLVRRRLPLVLFRLFLAPFVHPLTARDGLTSIQRAYTPAELRAVVETALRGTRGAYRHTVAPLGIRQIVEIAWR